MIEAIIDAVPDWPFSHYLLHYALLADGLVMGWMLRAPFDRWQQNRAYLKEIERRFHLMR